MGDYQSFPVVHWDSPDGDTALTKLKRFFAGASAPPAAASSVNNGASRTESTATSGAKAASHRSQPSLELPHAGRAEKTARTGASGHDAHSTKPTVLTNVAPSVRVSTANAQPRDIIRSPSSRSLAHDYRFGGQGISLSSPTATEGVSNWADFASIPGFPLAKDDLDDTRSVRSVSTLSKPGLSAAEVFRRIRGEGLSKDYWMKDEDAFNCFDCESVFTTFRRKHHCRVCGQIFCSRCASHIISSSRFGQQGFVRVCDLCLSMLKHSNDGPSQRNKLRDSTVMRISAPLEASMRPVPPSLLGQSQRVGTPFTDRSDEATYQNNDEIDSRPGTPRLLGEPSSPPRKVSSPLIQQIANDETSATSAAPFRERVIDEGDDTRALPAERVLEIAVPDQKGPTGERHPDVPPSTPLDERHPDALQSDALPGTDALHPAVTVDDDDRGALKHQPESGTQPILTLSRETTRGSATDSIPSSFAAGPHPADLKRRLSSAIADSTSLQAALQVFKIREHKSAMLKQMLHKEGVSRAGVWHTELLRLLDQIDAEPPPNTDAGDAMDVRDYIRVKRMPGGRPSDSEFVSGAVFTKNVLHKQMPRYIAHPRVALVTFPLEYQRHEGQLQSLEPMRLQEDAYLSVLVQRIVDLKPDVLLAQKNVSSVALKKLMDAGITVARFVKPEVIRFVARVTDARPMQIETHVPAWTGRCAAFRIQTFQHAQIPGQRKTLLRFEGCTNGLGCTVVLRGASFDELAKIKRILSFMCIVSHAVRFEKSVIADEQLRISGGEGFASLPAPLSNADANSSTSDPEQIVHATRVYRTSILSGSPFIKLSAPHILEQMNADSQTLEETRRRRDNQVSEKILQDEQAAPDDASQLDDPHQQVLQDPNDATCDSACEKAAERFREHFKYCKAYLNRSHRHLMLPEHHQKLYVLESLVCRATGKICSAPHVDALEFYSARDETLGSYIERLCRENTVVCDKKDCNHQRSVHYRRFVHGSLCITVELYQMAHRKVDSDAIGFAIVCPLCDPDPPARPVSAETRASSFAKYLEHCFYPQSFQLPCDHAVEAAYREFYRGFFAVRFTMHKIPLQSAAGPPNKIKIKTESKIALRNEEFEAILKRSNNFWDSVLARLQAVSLEGVPAEQAEECKSILEELKSKCEIDRLAIAKTLEQAYADAKSSGALDLMEARRVLQNKAVDWEAQWAAFEQKIFGGGVQDIRRMTAAQLRRLFSDPSVSPERKPRSADQQSIASATDTDEKLMTGGDLVDASDSENRAQATKEQTAELIHTKPDESAVISEAPSQEAHKVNLSKSTLRLVEASDVESDSTICADAPPSHSGSPFLTRHPSFETHMTESEADQPKSSNTKSSKIARLVDLYDSPQASSTRSSPPSPTATRPPLRRHLSDKARLAKRPRTPPSILSDDAVDARAAGLAFAKPSATLPRPTRIPARRIESSPALVNASAPASSGTGSLRARDPKKTSSTGSVRNAGVSTIELSRRPALQSRELSRSTLKGKRPASLRAGRDIANAATADSGPASRPTAPSGQRVSAITKHFNRLSREAEAEKQRRLALTRARRIRPVLESRMTLQVYDNVKDAVKDDWYEQGNESSDGADDEFDDENEADEAEDEAQQLDGRVRTKEPLSSSTDAGSQAVNIPAPTSTIDILLHHSASRAVNTTDKESSESKSQKSDAPFPTMTPSSLFPDTFTLPRLSEGESSGAEKGSILRALSNLWNYRNIELPQIDYPLLATEHLFADNPVLVREDEPSSIVAFSLSSKAYRDGIRTRDADTASIATSEAFMPDESSNAGDVSAWGVVDVNPDHTDAEDSLRRTEARHLLLQFEEGSSNFYCKVFFAEQFEALRRNCGCSSQFIESLSRCVKWESSGGKSKVKFLKTKDDRFIVKELSRLELDALLRFAPAYFDYVSKALFQDLPTILAKLFGFFRLGLRNPVTGHTYRMDVVVMENLFYDRQLTQVFDLKGSTRNRRVTVSTDRPDEVLMDENLIDMSLHNPLYVREAAKTFIQRATHNDSLFLSNLNVMDYSLVVGVDAKNQELVVGIVDFIRTYTWDKKLESWVKDSAFLGGGSSKPGGPTIVTPKQYKARFREAMDAYFLVVPDAWFEPSSCQIKDQDRFVPLVDPDSGSESEDARKKDQRRQTKTGNAA